MRTAAALVLVILVGCGTRTSLPLDEFEDALVATSASGAGGDSAQSSTIGPASTGPSASDASSGADTAATSAQAVGSSGAGGEGGGGVVLPNCGPIVPGDPSPCLGRGNVVCFDGDADGYIYPGMLEITGESWIIDPIFGGSRRDTLTLEILPENSSQDTWWSVNLSTKSMSQDLAVGAYENAERYPFEPPGSPGLDVSGDSRGCNRVTGRFDVISMDATDDAITQLTATFEHHCDNIPAVLRGCLHVEL